VTAPQTMTWEAFGAENKMIDLLYNGTQTDDNVDNNNDHSISACKTMLMGELKGYEHTFDSLMAARDKVVLGVFQKDVPCPLYQKIAITCSASKLMYLYVCN
jgi:hypothetical protein